MKINVLCSRLFIGFKYTSAYHGAQRKAKNDCDGTATHSFFTIGQMRLPNTSDCAGAGVVFVVCSSGLAQ